MTLEVTSASNVTPSRRLVELVYSRSWPTALTTVPPIIRPPWSVKGWPNRASRSSVASVLVSVPVSFTVPPLPVNVWRSAVVNAPPSVTVLSVAAIVPEAESFDQVPLVLKVPLATSIAPVLDQVVPARLTVAPSTSIEPALLHDEPSSVNAPAPVAAIAPAASFAPGPLSRSVDPLPSTVIEPVLVHGLLV